ncbi:MAG: hypothetical protein QME58_12485 [Bacteroidota bacterium]|nr:hypothetical protein [Bacteroidota bacterium]
MYRGFQTYRHFLNSKLHALSALICGDDTVLDAELKVFGVVSTKDLSDADALAVYINFKNIASNILKNKNQIDQLIGEARMTANQRACIIKITKYKFNWGLEATFSYILETLPNYRKRLSPWEIQNNKLRKLYSFLSAKEADKIIKRLDKIQKRNQNKMGEVS